MTLPFAMAAAQHTTCYNGALGPCTKCRRVAQLTNGLCLACRQEEQRQHPRPRLQHHERACADCGAPVGSPRRRYCDECAAAREKANVRAVKARQYQRRKGAL